MQLNGVKLLPQKPLTENHIYIKMVFLRGSSMLTGFITSEIWFRKLREENKGPQAILSTPLLTKMKSSILLRDGLVTKDQFIINFLFLRELQALQNPGEWVPFLFCPFGVSISWQLEQILNKFQRLAGKLYHYLLFTSSANFLTQTEGYSSDFWRPPRKTWHLHPSETFSISPGVQLGSWIQSVHQLLLLPSDLARNTLAIFHFSKRTLSSILDSKGGNGNTLSKPYRNIQM